MGVLDIPSHRFIIREIAENSIEHVEVIENTAQEDAANNSSPKPRRQRTPKLGRKCYDSHDLKRGNGVRQRRRNDNLFFLYSLVDGLDPEDLEDEDFVENRMTAFGELFINSDKMQAWTQFMNLSEEQQRNYLEEVHHCHAQPKDTKTDAEQSLFDGENINPNFQRINKKIQDYLRSDQLSKDSIQTFEEDFMFSFNECSLSVLVLSIPSSYERLLVYGLCQYMQLQGTTHKFKRKCLMEIEAECQPFQLPSMLLSDYLETVYQ